MEKELKLGIIIIALVSLIGCQKSEPVLKKIEEPKETQKPINAPKVTKQAKPQIK